MKLYSVEIYFKSSVIEPVLFTANDDGGCELGCTMQGNFFMLHKKKGLVEDTIPYPLKQIKRIVTTEEPPMELRDL